MAGRGYSDAWQEVAQLLERGELPSCAAEALSSSNVVFIAQQVGACRDCVIFRTTSRSVKRRCDASWPASAPVFAWRSDICTGTAGPCGLMSASFFCTGRTGARTPLSPMSWTSPSASSTRPRSPARASAWWHLVQGPPGGEARHHRGAYHLPRSLQHRPAGRGHRRAAASDEGGDLSVRGDEVPRRQEHLLWWRRRPVGDLRAQDRRAAGRLCHPPQRDA